MVESVSAHSGLMALKRHLASLVFNCSDQREEPVGEMDFGMAGGQDAVSKHFIF